MCKAIRPIPLLLSFALTLAVGLSLAAVSGPTDSPTQAVAKTTKSSPATVEKTTSSAKNSSANPMDHVLAPAEDLSGTITLVDPAAKEITLVGSNGIPYDFDLTRTTRIQLSNQKIEVNELASETHKSATIHFLPTSRGNLAQTIQISAS
jgi:hypothetical protein